MHSPGVLEEAVGAPGHVWERADPQPGVGGHGRPVVVLQAWANQVVQHEGCAGGAQQQEAEQVLAHGLVGLLALGPGRLGEVGGPLRGEAEQGRGPEAVGFAVG